MSATRLSVAVGLVTLLISGYLLWNEPWVPVVPVSFDSHTCHGISFRNQPNNQLVFDLPSRVDNKRNLHFVLDEVLEKVRCIPENSKIHGQANVALKSSRLIIMKKLDNSCFRVDWEKHRFDLDDDAGPSLCITLEPNQFLYGGAATHTLRWPSSRQNMDMRPFYSSDILFDGKPNRSSYWGSVLERYWVTADGFMLRADDTLPLYVSVNSKQMCWKAQYSDHYVNSKRFIDKRPLELGFTVCSADNIQVAHHRFSLDHLGHSVETPDLRILRSPIWSTWARYKTAIDQEKVLEFAKEIVDHKFGHSQLEIDDKFSTTYGDFDFDPKKFPNATAMISQLHQRDFRVTAWVTPFAEPASSAFEEGSGVGAWITTEDRRPAIVRWWQGEAALLDVTSEKAREWYQRRLLDFQRRYGLDGFKFDAGETDFLPNSTFLVSQSPLPNVGSYASFYARLAANLGPLGEVRVGHRSQEIPLMVRMFDKHSTWSAEENGLRTLIPNALLSALLGYSYILPDMIGGNAYDGAGVTGKALPERELYVRWLQVTAFLPAMQFSIAPWDYDEEVVKIGRTFVKLREEKIYEHLKEAVMLFVSSGTPVIRPLWWAEPTNEDALLSEDQFLVGDCLLVAPVVHAGQRSRDVFLPRGRWRDGNSKPGSDLIVGPRWIRQYPAPLGVTPWFECP